MAKCRLYDLEAELKESHIIPKFIIDYFKSTGSPYFRGFNSPNQRRQDGMKRRYLSHAAEQDFSLREKWFAENIFKPFMKKGQDQFVYDENLYYFLVSVLWRGLMQQLELPEINKDLGLRILYEVETDWKSYLAGRKKSPSFSDINLLLTGGIESHNTGVTGLEYYFTRTIDFTILANDTGECIYIYCKFLRFVVWATIRDTLPNINEQVIIRKEGGILHYPQLLPDAYLVSCLVQRAKVIAYLPRPSDLQQEKIVQELKKNPGKFLESDAMRAIANDLRLDDENP